jgi:hypothetical protein
MARVWCFSALVVLSEAGCVVVIGMTVGSRVQQMQLEKALRAIPRAVLGEAHRLPSVGVDTMGGWWWQPTASQTMLPNAGIAAFRVVLVKRPVLLVLDRRVTKVDELIGSAFEQLAKLICCRMWAGFVVGRQMLSVGAVDQRNDAENQCA